MLSFGEKLRHERESRQTAIEEIASTTKIHLGYLQALEQNEFDALPGRAFGKLYIRAYAEVLGFDPQPLIDDYDRERMSRMRAERAERRERERSSGLTPGEHKRPRRRFTPGTAAAAETRGAGRVDGPPAPPAEPVEPRAMAEPEPAAAGPEPAAAAPDVEVADPEVAEAIAAWVAAESSPASPGAAGRRVALGAGLAVGLTVVAVALYFAFFRASGEAQPAATPSPAAFPEPPPAAVLQREPPAVEPEAGQPVDPEADPPAPEIAAVSEAAPEPADGAPGPRLSIEEFGTGRGVVGRRLEQPTDRFAEGQVAWFTTRVLGGGSGDRIRHVWLREGRPVQSIELEVGGPRWRTHSRKTLWGAGEWAVEARDVQGRTLARASFTCVPAGS
jgi:hypothetical protein